MLDRSPQESSGLAPCEDIASAPRSRMRDKNAMDAHGMVLAMGVTGSGKSAFVNLLKAGSGKVGKDLLSAPQQPQAVKLTFDRKPRRSVTVVDTPGFTDTQPADATTLMEVLRYLSIQYTLEIPLKGILYFHPIHEPLKSNSATHDYLQMLPSLCKGPVALENVIIVTTRWEEVANRATGIRREQELIDTYLGPMLDKGATMMRFHGSAAEAQAMVSRLVSSDGSLELDVQRELVDKERRAWDLHLEMNECCCGNLAVAETMGETVGQRAKADVERERGKLRHLFRRTAVEMHVFLGVLDIPCINRGDLTC